ncbi:uncharacterized protein LOC133728606 [Rosa rugosa]|uniref:uncharacterized protein LOC133728606 n=1 Tax=Rosa rugosa TaxID=74645 RepID=UPI002B405ECD|nr:uncharacterized protein LOC133728606 [Rosa rugosa]
MDHGRCWHGGGKRSMERDDDGGRRNDALIRLPLTWPGSDPTLPSLLLNSHLDSVPAEPSKWAHPPFSAHRTPEGHIFAHGAQDDKCIAIQYLEAIRNLKGAGFNPIRIVHVSYVPDEEIGGLDGAAKFAVSDEFKELKVGFVLDEGQASPGDEIQIFYADRTPWNLIVKAKGMPDHGSRMFDNSAMENLMKSVELMARFREAQFDEVKARNAANSEVISVNPVYFKSGIVSGDVRVMWFCQLSGYCCVWCSKFFLSQIQRCLIVGVFRDMR